MVFLRLLSILAGIGLITFTATSAVRTFVVPRGLPDRLTRIVYIVSRRLFNLRLWWATTYTQKDRVMAYYAPLTLVTFPIIWLTLISLGFAAIYWGFGGRSWSEAFRLSGSAITTLGFATADGVILNGLLFFEASIGLVMVAILISYLPTMYSAYSDRESAVTLLDIRAGSPPSSIELIKRTYRIGLDNDLSAFWQDWERWFARVEESHTSLPSLTFYRSPVPEYNWVIAAGVVLDSAVLFNSVIEKAHDPREDLCIRAGYLALRRIAGFFGVQYKEFATADDPISISRRGVRYRLRGAGGGRDTAQG